MFWVSLPNQGHHSYTAGLSILLMNNAHTRSMLDLLEALFTSPAELIDVNFCWKLEYGHKWVVQRQKIALMSELAVVPTLIYRQPVPLIIISFQNLLFLVLFHPSRHISWLCLRNKTQYGGFLLKLASPIQPIKFGKFNFSPLSSPTAVRVSLECLSVIWGLYLNVTHEEIDGKSYMNSLSIHTSLHISYITQ